MQLRKPEKIDVVSANPVQSHSWYAAIIYLLSYDKSKWDTARTKHLCAVLAYFIIYFNFETFNTENYKKDKKKQIKHLKI